jgi:hypothetical protein
MYGWMGGQPHNCPASHKDNGQPPIWTWEMMSIKQRSWKKKHNGNNNKYDNEK